MASDKPFETFDPNKSRNWSFFTDGVMGGVSQGKAFFGKSGSDNFVRIEGNVSTDNNGGFIQIRHSLTKSLDDDIRGKLKLEAFQPSSSFLRKTIKSSSIKSIGIVAYGRDHQAKIDVSEISFIK